MEQVQNGRQADKHVAKDDSKEVLVHHNDEAEVRQFSVERANDVGNWIDSFPTMSEALAFIDKSGLQYDAQTGFRDSARSAA